MENKMRMPVNILMTIVLLCLMAYTLIGEFAHELLGVVMFILFGIHHYLNRRWLMAVFKGRYNPYRTLQTILVILLCISVTLSALSGIILSRYVFSFLPSFGSAAIARSVHMVCAYLNYVLMSLHLGLHCNAMMSRMNIKNKGLEKGLQIAGYLFCAYGVYAFFKRRIAEYLFLMSHFVYFDANEALIFFFIDYLAIMGFFVFIGNFLAEIVKKLSRKRS